MTVQVKTRSRELPPGQEARQDFPRFGVWDFADYRTNPDIHAVLHLTGDIEEVTINQDDLSALPRVEQVSDFHCVTTWTYRDVRWGGYRFRDVYEQLFQPHLTDPVEMVVFRAHDKYKSSLLLEDALGDDVLLADNLDGKPLSAEHGAPLRLVAPAHYGYKNVKHLHKIEFLRSADSYRPRSPRFVEHPRARVALEERGRFLPGWIFRYLYRPLIGMTVRRMQYQ